MLPELELEKLKHQLEVFMQNDRLAAARIAASLLAGQNTEKAPEEQLQKDLIATKQGLEKDGLT